MVEFPDWQYGEVELRCDLISNCTLESSGGCNIFVLVIGDKGWCFLKIVFLQGRSWKKSPQFSLGCLRASCHCGPHKGGHRGRPQWTDPQGRSLKIIPSSHAVCLQNLKHVYFKTRHGKNIFPLIYLPGSCSQSLLLSCECC